MPLGGGASGGNFPSAWSPDGQLLAVALNSQKVGIWDPETGIHVGDVGPSDNIVQSISWSPDGTSLTTSDTGGNIQVWDVSSGQKVFARPGSFALWAPQGRLLAFVGPLAIEIWDPIANQRIALISLQSTSFSWSPDGTKLVTTGLVDPSTPLSAHGPDGVNFPGNGGPAGATIWNAVSGKVLFSFLEPQGCSVPVVAWSPDGGTIASDSFCPQTIKSEKSFAMIWTAL